MFKSEYLDLNNNQAYSPNLLYSETRAIFADGDKFRIDHSVRGKVFEFPVNRA